MKPSLALFLALLSPAWLSSCSYIINTEKDSSEGGDGDTDTDGDTDADADGDTDVDTDAFCEQSLSTAEPSGPDCYSGTLSCGDIIDATTEGGSNTLSRQTYLGWFCSTNPNDYGGTERVYFFNMPAGTAEIKLESPCKDLDLFTAHWTDDESCPREGVSISECEGGEERGDDSIELFADRDYGFAVIVEGKDGVDGNFRLSVECTPL